MITKLGTEARVRALQSLPAWQHDAAGDALVRTFRFPDFRAAWAFMEGVAELANAQDHHPEWSNVYGRVEIRLTTHDAGGLSARDVRLAEAIDRLPGAVALARDG